MTTLQRLFIKICGMTTPVAVDAALSCEVDAIGFVFSPSVREVNTQRAIELAAPARHKAACVAVTRSSFAVSSLRFPSQSESAPENTLVMDAVASAIPSMKPTASIDAPSTVTR